MAANATFALKPGVWFLRVRFVIFAPDSRREPSPPSGRKSTQPTVQILEASSSLSMVTMASASPDLLLNRDRCPRDLRRLLPHHLRRLFLPGLSAKQSIVQ